MLPEDLDAWPRKNEPPLDFAIRDLGRGLANISSKEIKKVTFTEEEITDMQDTILRKEELPLQYLGKLLACTRFRRHQVWCDNGTGGRSCRGGSLRGSSSLRPCA